ncbi:putative Glutamate-gated chloride channel [Hypsibius exemplaris]|uniref:Glutamate-gated chloride channel n=1 Tax=Hypsibius exemplaris TaxID=2072580 RepID=A0A1W0X0E0_HYPEX|nr:putative Glutamate-gated chloride channel [Hypsibius exemplaris]
MAHVELRLSTLRLFSCLKVKLKLQRRISYHLTQTYLPTILIVSVSWVTFWLSVEAVPARVSLGITTLLTMTTLIGGAKQGLPAVSYIKALDVWMGTCTFFVFSTLLEYVVVSKTSRRKVALLVTMPSSGSAGHGVPRSSTMSPGPRFEHQYSPPGTAKSPSQNNFRPQKLNGHCDYDVESPVAEAYPRPGPTKVVLTPAQQAKRIDIIARVLFPSMFGAFNFVYWTYYLLQSWEEAG